jgi:ABC-type transport system substrate-binding protein
LIDGGLGAIPDNIDHWHMPGGTTDIPALEQGATDSTVTNLQLSQWIEGDLHSAGLTSITHTPLDFNYIVGTWLTPPYMSWDMTIGIGLVFGVDPVVEVMYHVDATPFANIWGLDDEECNTLIDEYLGTLSEAVAVAKVWKLESRLNELMPMIPMITSNTYTCAANQYVDPETGDEPGVLGFVNMKGFGGIRNDWSRLYSRREELGGSPPLPIADWLTGVDAEIINPLVSDTTYEWNLMGRVYNGLHIRNPYTHMWMPWGTNELSTVENGMIQLWNGTHRTTGTSMPETERPWIEDIPPEGSPGEVIGEWMEFTLRDDMTWHDNEPVTTADCEFMLDLCVNQDNERYDNVIKFVHDVVVVDTYTFRVYFTGRYAWAATDIGGLVLLTPMHVWKPYIAGEDLTLWTEDDNDHRFWDGSEWISMDWSTQAGGDYTAPTVNTPSGEVQLTHLLGSGYCVFPQGGWVPEQSMRLIRWDPGTSGWYYERIHRGDNDFSGYTDMVDIWPTVFASGTEAGMPNWVLYNAGLRADMANPAGTIDGRDRAALLDTWGYYWYPHQTLP